MAESALEPGLTDDAFLGGALRILQPERGFRSGLEAVLLAAAIPAQPGESALEAGSGTGAASLCLAHRVPEARVTGLEREESLAALADRNAARNGLGERVAFETGAVETPPRAVAARSFDHVFANPPYFEEGEVVPADDPARREARRGPEGTLTRFVDFCVRRAGPKGTVTLIYRAERLDRLLEAVDGRLGALRLCPLWPRSGVPAKLLILSGRKASRAPLTLLPGLVLHGPDGGFTPEADAILRRGTALDLTAGASR